MLFHFNEDVNRFFLETFNRVHGTEWSVENATPEIWLQVRDFLLLSKWCPKIDFFSKPSKIELMRKRAINGNLPVNVKKGGIQSENEGGDSKTPVEDEKGSANRYTVLQNQGEYVPAAKAGDLGGFNMVKLDYMRNKCRIVTENAVYHYASARTGKTLEFKGTGWRSKYENRKSGNGFRKAYNEVVPCMKEALFVTLKSPVQGKYVELKDEAAEFFDMCQRFRHECLKNLGLACFSVYEYAMGTGLHCHLIVMTGEDFENLESSVEKYAVKTGFESFYHAEQWNLSGDCEYLLKTLSTGTDELNEKFQKGGYMPSVHEEEAFVIWDLCTATKKRQLSFPKIGRMKRREREIVQKIGNPLPQKSEPIEKIAKLMESDEKGKISHGQAREMFKNEVCWKCGLECGLRRWLDKCVKPSNSMYYMDLVDFLRSESVQ